MLEDLDDGELVAKHVAGDPYAFGVLVTRHRDRAWAVALRTLGDPTEAADAVQDAFISAYRTVGKFRGDARFSTWLHRIVVNACLDRHRRQKVRATVPLDESTASVADPRDLLDERETATEVTAALARLGTDQRMAIVLVDLEGVSVDEAAAILGVAPGTVKSRCHRGRAQLAVHLGHLRPERLSDGTADPPGASHPRPQPDVPSEADS